MTICSKICERAVGIMVPRPWKKPRRVPTIDMMKVVTANTLRGAASPSLA